MTDEAQTKDRNTDDQSLVIDVWEVDHACMVDMMYGSRLTRPGNVLVTVGDMALLMPTQFLAALRPDLLPRTGEPAPEPPKLLEPVVKQVFVAYEMTEEELEQKQAAALEQRDYTDADA